MKLGVTIADDKGLESRVSVHFGQCPYFLLVDIEDGKITKITVVKNNVVHGGGGCLAVDEMLKHNVSYVIAGGMGRSAQNKFAAAGIKVYGYDGIAKEAIDDFLKNKIGELESCKEHSSH